MKKQVTFEVEDREPFLKLTKEYFLRTGFTLKEEHENRIVFSKGSTLLNMVTFNPLSWKSLVTIEIQDRAVAAVFDIHTAGQLVTPKEEKLWDTFIDNYRSTLVDKVDRATENQRQIQETKRDSLSYLKWAVLGGIALGIPFGFVAYWTSVSMLAPMGAALGAVWAMKYKMNQDKKKNNSGQIDE